VGRFYVYGQWKQTKEGIKGDRNRERRNGGKGEGNEDGRDRP